ncbi:NAD(P)/FAD-dependent oxidoreductase [Thermovibrio sp.]
MEFYDVIVVGAGPAGFNAAKAVRELYPEKRLLVINDRDSLQIPCSIPYVMSGRIPLEENAYPLGKVKEFGELLIDRVVSVEPSSLTLFTSKGKFKYEKLVISTGWLPRRLNLQGEELEGIYYIDTTTEGVRKLKEEIERSEKITLIGAGFISLGFADQIGKAFKGKEITVIEAGNHIASGVFCRKVESEIEENLSSYGVKVIKNCKVQAFKGEGRVRKVITDKGEIDTSLVLVFIGFLPNSKLALDCGLEVERGFIKVDEYMRASAEGVFAAGNCAYHKSAIDGSFVSGMVASVSARDGRLVALNLFGPKVKDYGIVPAGITEVGGKFYGFAGYTERVLESKGVEFKFSSSQSLDGYPKAIGSSPLKVNLYFDQKGLLLGGEVIGKSRGVWSLVEFIKELIAQRRKAEEVAGSLTVAFPPQTPPPLLQPVQDAALNFLRGE